MKVMKYFVLASLLCLSACGDDNDNKNNETPQNLAELTVDASEISIAQGNTRNVKITSGNGEYEVTSANEEVVTAEVDSDIVTLTAVEGHNNAQGVVYVKDKYYQRAKILVNTAAEFDLKLNKTLFTLYSQVEGADEAFVKIYTGNGGYSLEVIDENNCIEVDQSTLEDSESFTVKGIAQGNAEVKITDRKGKEAFVKLVENYQVSMYKTAIAILQNDEDAADAIQETILICWEKIGSLRNAKFFKTWMTRILIHRCYAIYNENKRTVTADNFPDIMDCSNKYGEIEWQEMLGFLNEKQRIVVELYYGQQFKVREIAGALQIGQSAVKSRLQSARKTLEQFYEIGKEASPNSDGRL